MATTTMHDSDVVIIGAGPVGLLTASIFHAFSPNTSITIYEKNAKAEERKHYVTFSKSAFGGKAKRKFKSIDIISIWNEMQKYVNNPKISPSAFHTNSKTRTIIQLNELVHILENQMIANYHNIQIVRGKEITSAKQLNTKHSALIISADGAHGSFGSNNNPQIQRKPTTFTAIFEFKLLKKEAKQSIIFDSTRARIIIFANPKNNQWSAGTVQITEDEFQLFRTNHGDTKVHFNELKQNNKYFSRMLEELINNYKPEKNFNFSDVNEQTITVWTKKIYLNCRQTFAVPKNNDTMTTFYAGDSSFSAFYFRGLGIQTGMEGVLRMLMKLKNKATDIGFGDALLPFVDDINEEMEEAYQKTHRKDMKIVTNFQALENYCAKYHYGGGIIDLSVAPKELDSYQRCMNLNPSSMRSYHQHSRAGRKLQAIDADKFVKETMLETFGCGYDALMIVILIRVALAVSLCQYLKKKRVKNEMAVRPIAYDV